MGTIGPESADRAGGSAPGDSVLTGSPAARRLYREIAADPAVPRRVDVVGPGGSGKTVLLRTLADLYTRSGIPVRHEPPDGSTDAADRDVALLLDDVHHLDDAALERVRRWAAEPGPAVVLARRPWPRPAAVSMLAAAFGASRAPLILGPLDRAGIAGRAALLLGQRPPVELVDLVAEQTGGSPVLVDRLLTALRERGLGDLAAAGEPPMSVVVQLGHDVDTLPAAVRDLVLALAIGAPVDPDVLGPLLDVSAAAVAELLVQAQATGLLAADGETVPLVRRALLRVVPAAQRMTVRRRLAEIQLDRGAGVLAAARGLLGTEATGSRMVAVFSEAGDEALRACLPVAGELYTAAVAAGAASTPLAARRAEAALLAGDLDTALARADEVLSDPSRAGAGDPVRAGTVAAAALAHRGMLARSAQLYRWLGVESLGEAAILAVPALIGTGALDEARDVLAATERGRSGRPPTLLAGAEELLARGVYDSVTGSPSAALSQLARSAALLEPSGQAALLPDTPVALGALVAMHCGELDVAQSLVDRAVAADVGGPAAAARHRLLQAWIAMHRGATAQARNILAAVPGGDRLEPRDELVAAALEVALARRANDLAALLAAWGRAREAIVRHPVDLYSLQPLGELLVGAARLREQSWVAPHLEQAQALLANLGGAPLWAASLHWAGLQAAIAGNESAAAARHAASLDALAGAGRYAGALATAGRVWLQLLTGDVDAAATEAAARELHAVGLAWEGGRLAGQAAIRTRDRKDMTTLLGCARALQAGLTSAPAVPTAPTDSRASAAAPRPVPGAAEAPPGMLSDREREVAELVLSGMTYKQIGEQLFISAKTVEHHVARMRQRLGSDSRGELLARLRMLVGSSAG